MRAARSTTRVILAVHAEAWGYRRIWVAEHHNMPGIASARHRLYWSHRSWNKDHSALARSIMLPNHAPYVIAEQFGRWRDCFQAALTLGWAAHPGLTSSTLRALRRTPEAAENFPQDVLEVQAFLLQPVQISASGPCRRQERKCRCGF